MDKCKCQIIESFLSMVCELLKKKKTKKTQNKYKRIQIYLMPPKICEK